MKNVGTRIKTKTKTRTRTRTRTRTKKKRGIIKSIKPMGKSQKTISELFCKENLIYIGIK